MKMVSLTVCILSIPIHSKGVLWDLDLVSEQASPIFEHWLCEILTESIWMCEWSSYPAGREMGLPQKCQVLRFVHNYYAFTVNITVLQTTVRNYGFLILKFFFNFFNFKWETSNITWAKIATIFDNKFLTIFATIINCF